MFYLPRKPQMVSAIQFKGDLNDYDIQRLGVTPLPLSARGQCQCGQPLSKHGMVDNNLICPGTYIMFEGNQVTNLMSKSNFEAIYKPLWEEGDGEVDANKNREEDTNKETRSEEEGGNT